MMMILLDIMLSIVAAFVGSLAGSLFWTFHLGLRWLRQLLLDDSALKAFYLLSFKPHGGLGAMLRDEGAEVSEYTPLASSIWIRVEVDTFPKIRRYCVITSVILF